MKEKEEIREITLMRDEMKRVYERAWNRYTLRRTEGGKEGERRIGEREEEKAPDVCN